MKFILFLSILFSTLTHASEERDLFSELFEQNTELEQKPETIIIGCRNNNTWCRGYATAVIHNLKEVNTKLCLPTNEYGKQNNEGVLSIIDAWLYRQPNDNKVTLNHAVVSALTEHNDCQ